jgi:hypothetical protein
VTHHDKDIIVINGRRYSAHTGKPLDGAAPSVDGLARPAQHRHIADTVRKHQPHTPEHPTAPQRQPMPAHAVHNRAHPADHALHARHHVSPAHHAPSPHRAAVIEHRQAAELRQGIHMTHQRQERARHIQRSGQISKFSAAAVPNVARSPAQVPLPASEPPVMDMAPLPAHAAPHLRVEPAREQTAAAEPRTAAHTEAHAKPQVPQKRRRIRQALKKPKGISLAAAAMSVLVIAGYVLYLNVPNIALRVAASRSGVEASLPGYKPDGFRFSGPVSYSEGSVVLGYSSATDARGYRVTQRSSDWDSQSLLENYVRREGDQYVTFQEKGLTIYVFGGSNAAWVNGGIWYTIEGDSLLSTDQLLKIATSL